MEEWKEYKIGDICRIKHGFAFKGIHFVNEPQKYVCVTPGNFALKGGFKNDKPKYYNGPIPEDYVLQKDDLVVTMTDLSKNGDTLGYSALIPYDEHYTFLHNQRIGLIEIISNEIDKHFLYWVMRTYDYQRYIVGHCSGSTVKHTSPSGIGSYIFRCPDMKMQKEISSVLDNLDDKIEVNRRINDNLEQQAQALFKSWFVDFEPFKDGEFVESELGMIPKGWRVGTLSEVAIINPARTLKKGNVAIYLDMKNMPTAGSFPSTWEKKEYAGGMKFQNHDTIMARITPCLENGKVAYVNFLQNEEVAFGSTEYIVMTTNNNFMPELLYYLCRDESFKSYATKNMNGSSGRQRVSGETIGKYKIAIPPKSLLEPIAPYFKSIMDITKKNGMEIISLSSLRDTLLPRLMSGELKINDVSV